MFVSKMFHEMVLRDPKPKGSRQPKVAETVSFLS